MTNGLRFSAVLVAGFLFSVAACVFAAPAGAAANGGAACDRACLDGFLNRYLDAVFRHDPAAAQLAVSHKATINGAPLEDGKDAWLTQTGLGRVQRHFIDPETGGAAYFGELMAGDKVEIASVRIKVENGKITETEWVTGTSPNSHWYDPEGLEHYPPPMSVPLDPADRVSRAQLIATANTYLQALNDHNDGSNVPKIVGCDRFENGARSTHVGRASPGGGPPQESGDCTSGFAGLSGIINLQPRRFALVDEEAGVVMGATIFHRPPGAKENRNLMTGYFFERGGKIASIYTALYYLGADAPDSSGW